MKQREKNNTIRVYPHIYSSPYYELETWIDLENAEDEDEDELENDKDEERKKRILEDFANNKDFIKANHPRVRIEVCPTKKRALTDMDEVIDYDDHIHSYFFIREKPLYVMMQPSDYIKEWVYWRGLHIDESLVCNYEYDDNFQEAFRGRPKEMIRFNVGDIAIELGEDGSSYWGVVASVPPTCDGKSHGDYSADRYTIYTSEHNHRHVLAHRLVRPWRIPDYIEELLRKETAWIGSTL